MACPQRARLPALLNLLRSLTVSSGIRSTVLVPPWGSAAPLSNFSLTSLFLQPSVTNLIVPDCRGIAQTSESNGTTYWTCESLYHWTVPSSFNSTFRLACSFYPFITISQLHLLFFYCRICCFSYFPFFLFDHSFLTFFMDYFSCKL